MLEKGRSCTTGITRFLRIRNVLFSVVFAFLLGWSFLPVGLLHAQTPEASQNVNTVAAEAGINGGADLFTIIGRVINIVLGFIGIVVLGYVLYGGYLWMSAAGDAKQVEQAKAVIKNAIIGVVILASAFAIVNFIMSQLGGVSEGFFSGTGSTGAVATGFPDRAGSLGAGIIRDHFPMRGARGVARNTSIIVTFKEPIKISSMIKDYNDNGTPSDLSDDIATSTTIGLNADNVKIFATAQGRTRALATDAVRVQFTPDRQTFVFRPVEYLGSSVTSTDYTVALVGGPSGILLETCSVGGRCPAFGGSRSSGYEWQFQVSTNVDLTPPRITSVVPMTDDRYAPNIVVQLNFSEALNPVSAAGVIRGGTGFNNIEVAARPATSSPSALPTYPNGEYKISNGYTTVEFVTDRACGINSCGRQMFCLPFDSAIEVTTKAARLASPGTGNPQAAVAGGLFDGIVDAASNSLDGNDNGIAEGPGVGPSFDNRKINFRTTNEPDRHAPFIRRFLPTLSASFIPVDQSPYAQFDSLLQSSTVINDNILLLTSEVDNDTFWWVARMQNMVGDRVMSPGEIASSSRALIEHRLYMAATSSTSPQYYPSMGSGIQNIYQNCFNPASSDATTAACAGAPNCCNGVPSATACAYPVTSTRP